MKTNNKNNHSITLGICALTLAIAPLTACGQSSIGIDYAGRQWSIGGNTPMTLANTATAGAVPQMNWNNVGLDGGSPQGLSHVTGPYAGALSDNSGAATSVAMTYTLDGEWSVDQANPLWTGNRGLLDGYVDDNGSAPLTVSLGNIPYSMYDVYVYVASSANGNSGSVSLNGGAPIYYLSDAVGYNYSNPLIQATATSIGGAVGAQYVEFADVTGASFSVVQSIVSGNNGLAGLQIVAVPEPSVMALAPLCGLTLLGMWFRRNV